jgi:K+-sensing histidine kinase KdpD
VRFGETIAKQIKCRAVDDPQERVKMLATIAEMDSMVGAALQFARDEATTEPQRPTDIAALVASIDDDMADAGMPVKMQAAKPIVYNWPDTLKRAVRNLLDNTIKYGNTESAAIQTTPKQIEIIIDDEGPGIPAQELTRVFDLFYRIEGSRSRDTGGRGSALRSLFRSSRPTAALSSSATDQRGAFARKSLSRDEPDNDERGWDLICLLHYSVRPVWTLELTQGVVYG